ncbi:MAG: VOC family protein [Clostridiales bacterium]|jgi:lactoylglutathione lyase|nr:VOC family protein [Clostridiales bacterium]
MITGIYHNAMNVLDMEKSLRFYVDGVGMKFSHEIKKEDGSPWIVYLSIGNAESLELFYGGVKDHETPYSEEQIGYHHWCITCTDLAKLHERVLKTDTLNPKDEGKQPSMLKNGGKNFWIHDPDGNALEIVQPKPVEEYAGRDELLGIGHWALAVQDIPKAVYFYTTKLGFRWERTLNKDGEPWIDYLIVREEPRQTIELFHNASKSTPNEWNSAGSPHVCFSCDNVQAMVELLRERGVPIYIEPKIGADGKGQAWIRDPEGHRIELMTA